MPNPSTHPRWANLGWQLSAYFFDQFKFNSVFSLTLDIICIFLTDYLFVSLGVSSNLKVNYHRTETKEIAGSTRKVQGGSQGTALLLVLFECLGMIEQD